MGFGEVPAALDVRLSECARPELPEWGVGSVSGG